MVVEARDYLDDFGPAARAEWQARVTNSVDDAIVDFDAGPTSLCSELPDTVAAASIEWTGFPERLASCLTRAKALDLLDAEPGLPGGRAVQEEYVEWRVLREGPQIQRIEFTTELPDYWAVLAAHEPERLLALVAEFAGEKVTPGDLFGRADALDLRVCPKEREDGFRSNLIELGTSPYNDGRRAICCMRQQSNTLFSLAALAVEAATPRTVVDRLDGRLRAPWCDESVLCFRRGPAQLGRASDPLVLERLAQLAFEGRQIAFDSPIGFYLQSVEPGRLLAPDGSTVPQDWFRFSRGAIGPDARPRFQRLSFEVPPKEGFYVSDVIDAATEDKIQYGGQIADLITVAVFLRVSEPEKISRPTEPVELHGKAGGEECSQLSNLYARLLEARL
jgi:hypothetical protein